MSDYGTRTNLDSSLYDKPCIGECRIAYGMVDKKKRCICGMSEKVNANWEKLSNVRKAKVVMGAWKSKGRYMPRQRLQWIAEREKKDFNEIKHAYLKRRKEYVQKD
jgi:predicted Fe-S protein YdhL (DUF1289 family)|tara:strand:- start:126 stop:443 length:318 start_codon:yes stop_codon:yes gene_type:complete